MPSKLTTYCEIYIHVQYNCLGVPLRQRSGAGCLVHCAWRNPIGFICDTQRRQHFGATFQFTAQNNGRKGFADYASVFPVYRDNLYATLLLLMFLPRQLKASFKFDPQLKRVSHVTLFGYDVPMPARYRMNVAHVRSMNDIRREISRVLLQCHSGMMYHACIPVTPLEDMLNQLKHCVASTPEVPAASSDETAVSPHIEAGKDIAFQR